MANPQWFEKNPKLAWAFYGHRQQLYRDTVPHRGFTLLKGWGEAMPQGHFAYTSNVDGHFQRAGFDQARLVECHGNIHRHQCCGPCHDQVWQESPKDLLIDLDALEARGELPRCPECIAIARPNVMMFYDWNWVRHVAVEQLDRYNAWINELSDSNAQVVVLELGAGTTLAAIRRESEYQCSQLNARLIRVNPREAAGPDGTISISLGALKALECIDSALGSRETSKASPKRQ
jgi:NAD-dependent SIR2 family protein deacetylase